VYAILADHLGVVRAYHAAMLKVVVVVHLHAGSTIDARLNDTIEVVVVPDAYLTVVVAVATPMFSLALTVLA
jgi:hypothetical protein